jgi:hypothetical protein
MLARTHTYIHTYTHTHTHTHAGQIQTYKRIHTSMASTCTLPQAVLWFLVFLLSEKNLMHTCIYETLRTYLNIFFDPLHNGGVDILCHFVQRTYFALQVYICIFMYVCMYACMCMRVYVYIYIYIYIYIVRNFAPKIHEHKCKRYMHAYIRTYIHYYNNHHIHACHQPELSYSEYKAYIHTYILYYNKHPCMSSARASYPEYKAYIHTLL